MNSDADWLKIFDGTTGTGAGADVNVSPLACNLAESVSVEYELATGTTAGTGVLEQSSDKSYAGVWSELEVVQVGAGAGTPLTAGAKAMSPHYPVGPIGFLRFRTTVNFSGGGAPGIVVRALRRY